jgi:hypothetical protein
MLYYSHPGLYYFDSSEFDYVNRINLFIASHRLHAVAYLLGMEAAVLLIWLNPEFFTRHFRVCWWALLGTAFLIAAFYAFNRYFDTDEFEHFHSAWNILQGKEPYIDFFQHHHPLIWYQNILPILLWGDSLSSLLAGRGINFLFFIGTLYLSFLLAKEITGQSAIGAIAVFLLLTFKYFIDAAIENRPDNPQTFFFLCSFYLIVRYWSDPKKKMLIAGGSLFALSFLYLQKAVLIFPSLIIVMAFFIRKKKLSFGALLLFLFSFSVPVLLFFSYYVVAGQFEEYLLFNWVINAYKQEALNFWPYFLHTLVFNPFFLILLSLSLVDWLRSYSLLDDRLKITLLAGLLLGILVCLTSRPWKQYFLPVWPLLAIGVAFTCHKYLLRLKRHARLIFPVMLLGLSVAAFGLQIIVFSGKKTHLSFLYAHQVSRPDDIVFDEFIIHNVFRGDLHFFWFSTHRDGIYESYLDVLREPRLQWLIKNRHNDFDFCSLVEKYKPRIIYIREDSDNTLANCPSVGAGYREQEDYPDLFILE